MKLAYQTAVLVASAGLVILSGCTKSVWENEYRPGDARAEPLRSGAAVRVREVPWARVNQTLLRVNEELTRSDAHYDDWSEQERERLKAEVLRGLQVSTPARDVEILGRSEFRTTDRVRPSDGSLEEFARKVGATTVVVASSYVGKTETVRQEAITEYRSGTSYRNNNRDDDRRRDGTRSETATIWVPMRVQADENAFVAFFLRERL